MGFPKLPVALVASLVICLALALPSQAQDSPQDYVASHNAARAQVGVGPITWDEKLAAYARSYGAKRAGDCNMIHSGGPYGENLAWGSWDMKGVEAVKMWVDEKPYYNYATNSCTGGKMCGHYTQIVWRNSLRVGCAKTKCKTGGTYINCNYDPAGNIVGQKPY